MAPAAAFCGRYCEDCAVAEVIADPQARHGVAPYAVDAERARALWTVSEHMIGTIKLAATRGAYVLYADVREVQIAAINERLREQGPRIKLVSMRARDAEITQITKLEDAVPLLLLHTAYKSYPESFLTEKKWDRLTKWLGTVSAYPTDKVDLSEVKEINDWIDACARAGLFVACSSGTTGKSAMLVASQKDIDFTCADGIASVQWGSAIRAGDQRTMAGAAGAVAYTHKNAAMGKALMESFVDPAAP